jgi:hypothetical protein
VERDHNDVEDCRSATFWREMEIREKNRKKIHWKRAILKGG